MFIQNTTPIHIGLLIAQKRKERIHTPLIMAAEGKEIGKIIEIEVFDFFL